MASKPVPTLPVVQKEGSLYTVGSESVPGSTYDVDLAGPTCNCQARSPMCKHVKAARAYQLANETQMAMELNGVGNKHPISAIGAKGKRESKLDKLGYEFGEVASGLQKEIRHGDVEAAVYWGLLLYEASPQYAWKRVLITASEDVGMADPAAVQLVNSLAAGWAFCRQYSYAVSPHALTQSIVALCKAPKSTAIEDLQSYTMALQDGQIKLGQPSRPVPEYARDAHTAAGKAAGKGWDSWYYDRHVTFAIPVNPYTEKLWEMEPDWKPELPDDVAREEPF